MAREIAAEFFLVRVKEEEKTPPLFLWRLIYYLCFKQSNVPTFQGRATKYKHLSISRGHKSNCTYVYVGDYKTAKREIIGLFVD